MHQSHHTYNTIMGNVCVFVCFLLLLSQTAGYILMQFGLFISGQNHAVQQFFITVYHYGNEIKSNK